MKNSMYKRILCGETTERDASRFRSLMWLLGLSLSGLGLFALMLLGG